jgi:hypothetical protein
MLRVMGDADDVIKNAGKFFSKLGGTIKQTTKTVTGLGRGSVKLELDQTRVAPGGTLKGRIVLALSEPVDAKRLVVTLHARQRHLTIGRSSSSRGVSSSHSDVYQFDVRLGDAKRYDSITLPFELPVPPDALDLRPAAGSSPLADVARTVASAITPTVGPIEWQVIGKLEIAWGRDLTSDVDIIVAR